MPINFATKVDSWDLLLKGLRPRIQEMPELEVEHRALEAVLDEARGLQAEQELLRARLREVIRERQEAEKRGHDLRGRLASLLRGKLGFTSEQLIAFGVAPRRRPRRKPGSEETVPAASTATPAPPQPKALADEAAPPAANPAEPSAQ